MEDFMRQATSEAKADAYFKAGSFGPFHSFFHQILHNSPADHNTTPVGHRTRASGHTTPDNEFSSPCPGNSSGDAMADIMGDLSWDEGDMSMGTSQDSSSYVDKDTIGPPEDSSTPPRHTPSFALSYHTSAPSSVQSPAHRSGGSNSLEQQSSSLQAIDSTLEESSLYSNPAIVQDIEQKKALPTTKRLLIHVFSIFSSQSSGRIMWSVISVVKEKALSVDSSLRYPSPQELMASSSTHSSEIE
ncbi:hypothetical protein DL95DRAFT_451584 [Leptodontidium sp. 2 PMI_412]|nr:hypothetical protein DL95DRAFT_451584 [Leptodontidium sp. 2 PMI_412]